MLKLLRSVYALLFIVSALQCTDNKTMLRDAYTSTEWNHSLLDSITISFSVESVFKPVSHELDCFDDGGVCYSFGSHNARIAMNYSPYPPNAVLKSLLELGDSKAFATRDVFPERQVRQPKTIKWGILDGIMVESSDSSFNYVDYVGYNQETYMWFDIQVKSMDTIHNSQELLLPLVKSILIRRKE